MKRPNRPPPLTRAVGRRNVSPRILIVCEDSESGRSYFLTLRRELRVHGADIHGPEWGADPVSIIDYAVHLKQRAYGEGVPFDHLWCVIDGDKPQRLAQAINKAKGHGIEVAVSTPCIEVWFRLHFEYSTRPCGSAKNAVKLLKEVMPAYTKGTDHGKVWEKLWRVALANGRQLAQHNRNVSTRRADPSTDVHLLVDLLAKHVGA